MGRLGAAVQLCSLPWLGFVPDDVGSAPLVAVARLSERLRILVGSPTVGVRCSNRKSQWLAPLARVPVRAQHSSGHRLS
jgi:hypothetical protein